MLSKEITVTPQRILDLSSFQGIVDFFTELGYDTTIDRTAEKDDATRYELHRHDDVNSKIVRFQHIAQNKDESGTTLDVYLYILKSVTAKIRDDIVRDLLRRHSGEYLFMLTSEVASFKELEFVFIDHISSAEQHQPFIQQTLFTEQLPVTVGPPQTRSLSIDCRHPDYRAIRLLSSFSYTRRYVLDQCKVISSAYDKAEISDEFFHNRSLFSDHYLKRRLPEEVPEWLQTEQEGTASDMLTEASAELRRLYSGAAKAFADKEIDALRTALFDPVFDLLGFQWDVKPKMRKRRGEGRLPDYTLSARDTSESPLVICLVYPWERSLDDYLERDWTNIDDREVSENPSVEVVSLLEQEKANWVILTNGRYWRLYSSKARSRATNYYEIDLLETLAIRRERTEDALKSLRYFWLFFRADAFFPKPRAGYETPPYICFLDYILREGERYARELGESLKGRIFDDIFPYFAGGFVRYAQQVGGLPQDLGQRTLEERSDLLQPFFEGTLAFLYRLLFLLYAESRDLLPVHDARYHLKSLTKMKEEIAAIAKNNKDQARKNIEHHDHFPADATATDLYDRLQKLFTAIDKGNDELNVPTYNGGLFVTEVDAIDADMLLTPDGRAAYFLATYKIPNRDLALGLDLMARDEDERKGKATKREFELVYVDYKSLGVRQLGSIYEGLLEFKLRIAVERMVVLKGKVLPLQAAIEAGQYKPGKTKAALYEPGTVYIENDRHDRKATGSYYTPDYIVKYIIEQTVGPILQEKFKHLRPKFREYQEAMQTRRENNEKRKALRLPPDDPYTTYKRYEWLADELFDLKVLDPAMGSGHFLVDTVDYITDRMTEFLRPLTPNPVHQKLQATRNKIVAEVESQNVSIDRGSLNELNLLKRQVLKRCVFGVDINYMAVTLTKVSLWLDTFMQGAPLSFLDYHLKWGNSLLGTTFGKIGKESVDSWLTQDLSKVVSGAGLAHELSLGTDSTMQEIAAAHQVHDQLLAQLEPYKALFNVWMSQYFGDKWARTTVETCHDQILAQDTTTMMRSNQEAYERAQELAAPQNKNFFHWELEFPEVFFKDNRRLSEVEAGFDAVIGNPPYVRQEGLGDDKGAFKELYAAYSSIADLYTYFIEGGHKLLHLNGRFGMITANKFMRANYGAALRSYLIDKVKLEQLVDFGDLSVFGDATTYPVIIIALKSEWEKSPISYALIQNTQFDQLKRRNFEDFPPLVESVVKVLPDGSFEGGNWSLTGSDAQTLLSKLKVCSTTLSDYVDGKIYYGVKTGFNEAFIIDYTVKEKLVAEDPRSDEIIKPLLVGEDIKRYDFSFKEKYLIFTRRGTDITQYKAVEEFLSQYKVELEPKPLTWDNESQRQWLGRKPGPYKWYEIQDNVAYYAEFEKPKIIYPVIAAFNKFTFDREGYYTNDKTFFIPTDNLYLLSILNSSTAFLFFRNELSGLRGGFLEYRAQTLVNTPIRKINFTTGQELRTARLNEAKQLYRQYITSGSDSQLLNFVDLHLGQQPEASDVVHDLLASLAENMLDLNTKKRTLQNIFLNYLETALGIQSQPNKSSGKVGIEALKGKDRLLDYSGDYRKGDDILSFKAIENILLENRQRFRQYLDSRRLRGIEDKYIESAEAIKKIKLQLKLSDDLLDSIVYKLYGLTEDEIKIVEEQKQ